MRTSITLNLAFFFALTLVNHSAAQQFRIGEPHARAARLVNTPQNQGPFRVAFRNEPAQSVLNSNYSGYQQGVIAEFHNTGPSLEWVQQYPTGTQIGTEFLYQQPNGSRAEFESRFADSTTKYWGDEYYPNLNGDLFGISKYECCDEWHGHCACLELTSTQKNCECTNPHRAHWTHGACGCDECDSRFYGQPGCDSCVGPRRRRAVSEYFHPRKYR